MAKKLVLSFAIAALLVTIATLCGQTPSVGPGPQNLARGRALFEQTSIRGAPGCASCHSLTPGVTVVGPSLAAVGARAESLLHSNGYHGGAASSEELLREAILTRDTALWGGVRHLIIPEWDGVLESQELADLAAFLASLN